MAFNEFPFLRYAIFFILGILIYPLVNQINPVWLLTFFAIIFLLYLILTWYTHSLSEFRNRLLISSLALTLWVLFGLLVSYSKDVLNHPLHLIHKQSVDGYIGIVLQHDEPKPRSLRNRIKITHIAVQSQLEEAEGEVIIYHQGHMAPGQVVAVKGSPQRVAPPNNPHEFDYAQFLSRQQIYHTHFVGKNMEVIGEVNEMPINFFFVNLRHLIQQEMDRTISHPRARQIAQALLLGQKNNLDKEVSEAYSTAGAMHILAVSGLHVGIIYGFFFLFFRPYKLGAYKRMVYLTVVIFVIWTYAFLTGMSPSVMRSATMFTIVSLAQMRSSSPSIYNGLALSAVLLLLFDPNLIYAVGFQLSYAALTGILLFQPLLVNMWLPKNKIVNKGWEITTVGIAAQLATFPISAYYFHTFPTYFILSNLVAIPGAFFIMAIGIPFMILSLWPWIGEGLGLVLDYLIRILNGLIFFIHDLPSAKITSISLEPWEIAWYYGLLALIFIVVTQREKKLIPSVIAVFMLGILISWLNLLGGGNRNEIYFYTTPGGRAVDHYHGEVLYAWAGGVVEQDMEYKVMPNRIQKGHTAALYPLPYDQENGLFYLPQQRIISTRGQMVEFVNFLPKEVAYFDGIKWIALSHDQVKWQDNKAYRIILE